MLAGIKSWWLRAALLSASGTLAALGLLRKDDARSHARAPARGQGLSIELPAPVMTIVPGSRVTPPTPKPPDAPYRRQRDVERGLAKLPPTTVSDLATAGGWMRSIATHRALPGLAGPEAERDRLEKTLAEALDPVARQNVIFLAVLTLPTDVSHPWLSSLMAGGSGGDAEDALLALAFDGDAEGRARFAQLARAPSRAPVRRLVNNVDAHEELGQSGSDEAREVLRSYRAIEVLDRVPYFKMTFELVAHAPWVPHPARTPDLDRELLPAWLARYPGHPGSDDMGVRLGRIDTLRGEHYEAARWYSRASTMPDQDLCEVAIEDLVATAELLLTPEDVDRLANEQGYGTPNRSLLQYIRLRRLAAERGFDVAVSHAAVLGRDEPSSVLGYAWNNRYAAPVPKGLSSGLAPAPPDDPLRVIQEAAAPLVRPERAPAPERIPTWWSCCDNESRLDPWPEPLQIDETLLMRQFRAWEAIASLELRAARARGDARADLLYKEAAILYHDPRAIFPAYAVICDFRRVFRHVTSEECKPEPASFGGFVRTSYPLLRAIRVFERIEAEHPRYAAMDKVLYSEGLAWVKLTRYGCDASEGGYGPEEEWPFDRRKIRNAVDSLERCATLCPWSPLADDAQRAVLYWKKVRPDAFE